MPNSAEKVNRSYRTCIHLGNETKRKKTTFSPLSGTVSNAKIIIQNKNSIKNCVTFIFFLFVFGCEIFI